MKPGAVNAVWMAAGAAVTLALVVLAVLFRQEAAPSEQLLSKTKRLEVVGRMQSELASASAAEKSAVLAITDRDSQTFADQARAAEAAVERGRTQLGELVQSGKEKELLAEFSQHFAELQKVDQELLDLAVKNTNLKAWAMAFGPAADALKEMDGALSRLLAEEAASNAANSKKVMLVAAGAQAGALRIEVLLSPHIAEETDKKMDEMEAAMSREDELVRRNLKELDSSNKDAQSAASSYARFGELRKQILKLSRENTDVRSLSLSLNQKRKITAVCEESLTALAKAIGDEPISGMVPASRPR